MKEKKSVNILLHAYHKTKVSPLKNAAHVQSDIRIFTFVAKELQ